MPTLYPQGYARQLSGRIPGLGMRYLDGGVQRRSTWAHDGNHDRALCAQPQGQENHAHKIELRTSAVIADQAKKGGKKRNRSRMVPGAGVEPARRLPFEGF